MIRKTITTLSAVGAVAIVAFLQFFNAQKVEAQFGQMPMPEVAVIRVESKPVVLFEELPGRTNAFKVAEIRPQVGGIITKKIFTGGTFVKENQQLYQINPSPFQASYNATKADLQSSEANLISVEARHKRYEELVKVEAVSKQEFDDLTAKLAQAKAAVAIAKANFDKAKIELDYTKVYAPISGKIGRSSVTEGALVFINQAESLATITQLDPIYVDITQPSADSLKMRDKINNKESLKVELILTDQNNKVYEHEGQLQFAESIVDQSTNSVQLRALFANPDEMLLPGLFVHAKIKFPPQNLITIPQNAATQNPDGTTSVWVLDAKNIVNPRIIEIGQALENRWVVNSGLNIGDIIVVEGFQKIKPDAKVSPIYVVEEKKPNTKIEIWNKKEAEVAPKAEEIPKIEEKDSAKPQNQEG